MPYLTFNDLSTTRLFSQPKNLNEQLKRRTGPEKMVFLSYRRKDREWVRGVVEFLKKLDVAVYIDYLDETLEDRANGTVAQKLRDAIKASSKFISLSTPNSSDSKWMPWELGLGDRIVNYQNVAILPLTTTTSQWNDQEYGKIYARIESDYSGSLSDPDDWQVIYPDNRKIKLKSWLTN